LKETSYQPLAASFQAKDNPKPDLPLIHGLPQPAGAGGTGHADRRLMEKSRIKPSFWELRERLKRCYNPGKH